MNETVKKGLTFVGVAGILGLAIASCKLIQNSKEKLDREEKMMTLPSGYTLQSKDGEVIGVKNLMGEDGVVKEVYRTPAIFNLYEDGKVTKYIQRYDYETNTFVREEYIEEDQTKSR